MKPSHQEYPHRNFQEEVEFLNEIFPSKLMKLQQLGEGLMLREK